MASQIFLFPIKSIDWKGVKSFVTEICFSSSNKERLILIDSNLTMLSLTLRRKERRDNQKVIKNATFARIGIFIISVEWK